MTAPITYKPSFVLDADYIAEILWNELDWKRIDTTPRFEYYHAVSGNDYTYGSGSFARTYHSQPLHPKIEALWRLAEQAANTKFDVVFLNGYKDQSDHLGWHADDSPEMDDTRAIAIVSLGAEREIWFKPQGAGADQVEKVLLQNGSLCLMEPGMQDTHFHRIPKAGKTVDKRISLTFRGTV